MGDIVDTLCNAFVPRYADEWDAAIAAQGVPVKVRRDPDDGFTEPDALVARAPELRDVDIVHLHIEGPGPHLAPEMAGHLLHRAVFIGPNARKAINEGRAEFIFASWKQGASLFKPWTWFTHFVPGRFLHGLN